MDRSQRTVDRSQRTYIEWCGDATHLPRNLKESIHGDWHASTADAINQQPLGSTPVPKTGKNARKVREEGSPRVNLYHIIYYQCTVGRPFPAHPLRACVRALETHTSCSCAVPSVSSLLLPAFPRAQKSPYKVVEYLLINVTTALFDIHHGIYGTLIGTPTPVTAPTQIVCGSYMDAK